MPAYHWSVDAQADLAEHIRAYPRRRTYLLPALHEVQQALGWLPGAALEMVGERLADHLVDLHRAEGGRAGYTSR